MKSFDIEKTFSGIFISIGFLIFLTIFAVLSLSACGEEAVIEEDLFSGTWEMVPLSEAGEFTCENGSKSTLVAHPGVEMYITADARNTDNVFVGSNLGCTLTYERQDEVLRAIDHDKCIMTVAGAVITVYSLPWSFMRMEGDVLVSQENRAYNFVYTNDQPPQHCVGKSVRYFYRR